MIRQQKLAVRKLLKNEVLPLVGNFEIACSLSNLGIAVVDGADIRLNSASKAIIWLNSFK